VSIDVQDQIVTDNIAIDPDRATGTASTSPRTHWPFTRLIVATLVLAIAWLLEFFKVVSGVGYPFVFILTICGYAIACRTGQAKAQSSAAVVSEQIIVLGIGSLVLHTVSAANIIATAIGSNSGTLQEVTREAINSFLHGLICAAVAPVVAMIIRTMARSEAEQSTGFADTADAARDSQALLEKIAAVSGQFDRLAVAVSRSVNDYETASRRLDGALTDMALKVKAQTDTLGDAVKALNDRLVTLDKSLASAGDGIVKFSRDASTAFSGTREKAESLATEIGNLTTKMAEGGVLLDGLRGLIASVDRFIQADRTKGN